MNTRVSVIIPCREVNSYTQECIKHCTGLDYPDYEILVLPDTEAEINLPPVKVIPTGPVSPSQKRNLALKATGDIIAFIDDDAYPSRDWLKEGVKHFQAKDVAAVGGPAVTPPDDPLAAKAGGLVFSSFMGSGSMRYRYIPRERRDVDGYPSCNLIIRKSVFQELNGFRTNFWPGEDTVLCLDIIHKLKKRIIYDPGTLVYHHRRNLFKPHLEQVWSYGVHRGYFVKKYPETSLKLSYALPSLLLLGIIFGIPAAVFSPVLRILFLSILGLYLLSLLISSLLTRDLKAAPLVFLGIALTHLTYGLGFLVGLCKRSLAR